MDNTIFHFMEVEILLRLLLQSVAPGHCVAVSCVPYILAYKWPPKNGVRM